MRILKRGTPPPQHPWMGIYSCAHCGSRIALDARDERAVIDTNDDQRDGYSVRVQCPVCVQDRWLSRVSDLPSVT